MPPARPARPRRRLAVRSTIAALTALAAVLVGTAVTSSPARAAAMPQPTFGPVIEPLSDYEPQTTCDPYAKPGLVAFRDLVLSTYPRTGDDGITRACSIGGTSEHKEGRAWDWMVSVHDAGDVAAVDSLLSWLFATDEYGNRYAMARRLGVMYIIWDKRIWGAYSADEGWRCYYACKGNPSSYDNDPHTGHVHFSFDWAGARKHTSYWGYGPAKSYQQWPGSGAGDLGAVTTGPVDADRPALVYVEDEGSVIAAERLTRH